MQQVVFSPLVASKILALELYLEVDFIPCDECGRDAYPPTKVRNAQVCPHDQQLFDEAEYQLEFGTVMCEWCDEVLVPELQRPHDCLVFTPEQWHGSTAAG